MRRLQLALLVSGALAFAACGSSGGGGKDGGAGKGGHGGTGGATGGTGGATGGTGGSTAGTGGSTAGTGGSTAGTGGSTAGTGGTTDGGAGADAAPTDAPTDTPKTDASDASDAVVLTPEQTRGKYLVGVLGCTGCHGADLSGKDMFVHDTTTNGYLSSANLTNDPTGIKDDSDQAIIDAFTKGISPDKVDGGTAYLFPNMPWYTFATLTTTDATDILAYLRSVPPKNHTVMAPTGVFATPLTSPAWTGLTLAQFPNPVAVDGGADGGTTSQMNGKYFASLLCVNCHTVNTGTTAPLMFDAAKLFQGGKTISVVRTTPVDGGADGGDAGADAATTVMTTLSVESANLTPDSTGIMAYTQQQLTTAVTGAKDSMGRAICGMRANSGITSSDAMDLAAYLQSIPAVTNATGATCYDM
jgi:hypothetical protein